MARNLGDKKWDLTGTLFGLLLRSVAITVIAHSAFGDWAKALCFWIFIDAIERKQP